MCFIETQCFKNKFIVTNSNVPTFANTGKEFSILVDKVYQGEALMVLMPLSTLIYMYGLKLAYLL